MSDQYRQRLTLVGRRQHSISAFETLLTEFLILFFCMLVGHVLADFPLQGEYIARGKNGSQPLPATPWWYVLSVHAFLHAAFVFAAVQVAWMLRVEVSLTPIWWLAALEFAHHWVVDNAKCHGRIGYLTDQGLHIAFKAIWVAVAVSHLP